MTEIDELEQIMAFQRNKIQGKGREKTKTVFGILAVLILIGAVMLISPMIHKMTGFSINDEIVNLPSYAQALDIKTSENLEYDLKLDELSAFDNITVRALVLSGKYKYNETENSDVKVYLEDSGGNRYLILNEDALKTINSDKEKSIADGGGLPLTGMAVDSGEGDSSPSGDGESSSDSTAESDSDSGDSSPSDNSETPSEETQPEPQTEEQPTEPTTEETPAEPPVEETPSEEVPEEQPTKDTNETGTNETSSNETIEENITEEKNITETLNETQEFTIEFNDICDETCDVALNGNDYKLIIEISSGELELDSVKYWVEGNATSEVESTLIEDDPRYEVIIDSAEYDNETQTLMAIFHHDYKKQLPISIETLNNYTLDYVLSQNSSNGGENVTLTMNNWNPDDPAQYFEIKVGEHSEKVGFGQVPEYNVSVDIKDAQNESVGADIEFLKADTIEKNASSLEQNTEIKRGQYDIKITPNETESPIKEIVIENINIESNVSDFIKIDDVNETEKNLTQYTEVYAIDPTALNFTNATVTVVAKGSELYKCKDWNFSEQTCLGEWTKLMDITPGEDYTFTLTPEDPGFAEINATAAYHLDENYSLISDIFAQIEYKDNVWSEPILQNHTVRVTYQRNMTNGNVIDVYYRSDDFSYFEVYYPNTTSPLLGRSNNAIAEGNWSYTTLSNMTIPSDVFDFRIFGSPIEFDHIHDDDVTPPEINWIDPTPNDGNTTSNKWAYLNTTITDASNTSAFFDWNNSLLGYWSMDAYNSTGIYDNSSYNKFGTFNGGLSTSNTTAGKFGRALDFDGTDDYINCGDIANFERTQPVSYEFWFNTTVGTFRDILVKYSTAQVKGFLNRINAGKIDFTLISSGSKYLEVKTATTWNDGQWHHAVVTYDGSSLASGVQIYVDGVPQNLTIVSDTLDATIINTATLNIGSRGTTAYFLGELDEVRIYNRTFSQEEISASYNNTANRLYHNFTNLNDGAYSYSAYAIDAAGNLAKTSARTVTTGADLTPPEINWVDPTPSDGNTTTNNWVYLNTTITDNSTISAFFDWNNSLAGYWSMDAYNSTGIYDNSSFNNFGTFNGGMGTGNITTGKFGKALDFDGSNDYLNCGNTAHFERTDPFSVEFWMNWDSSGTHAVVANLDQSASTRGWEVILEGSIIHLRLSNTWVTNMLDVSATHGMSTGAWNHVVMTYNGTSSPSGINIYINGVKKTTATNYNTLSGTIVNNTKTLSIGSRGWGSSSNYFNGKLDEVRIYNRTLSQEEISASYNNTANRLYHNFTNLNDGAYSYSAYAIDAAGNLAKTSARTITYNSDSVPPTVTIIRPENKTYNTQSNLPLNYTATDNVAVNTCWYSFNGGTNTSLPGCTNATFSAGTDGSYPIHVYANDTNGNVGSATQYFTIDSIAPQWSSPNANTPTTYSESALSTFNMTWTDATTAVNTVLFESNYAGIPQNHTMYLISGNAYGYNATLPAGTFYWKSYANDSAGNLNASSIQTFTINKASTTAQLYIDGARANKTITYGAQSNATAITDMGSVTLYRNGTAMGNPEIATLGAGYYNYTAVNAGNENYTGSSETFFLTVDKITPTLQLLLDGVADNKTVTYGTQSNATASESNSGDSDALYTLYRNDDIVSNPDVKTLGANTYTYVYNTSGGANYTSAAISRTLTVNKAPTDVRLYLNGNEGNASQTYGAQSNATATINVGGLAIQLSREGTPASNPDIGTLAAGYYNYTADFAGNENYSADSQTYFLTINKATPTLSLLINGLDSDDSIPVFTDVIINASSTIPAGAVIGLYEDDVLEGSSTSVNATRNYTTLGDRIWKINISETQNYTSAEKNHTISVVDAGTPQYSNLKEHPTDPAAYYPTKTYQFNATWTDNVEISTVILEFNGANYTLTDKAGNEYYKSFSNLAAGTYDYKWHANDTSNNWGSTPIQTYTVDKAVAALFLTMLPGNNADYGTTTTVSCSSNNLESSPALTRNANGVSNPDAGILEVGTYNYACTAAATQNYTSASATGTLIIGKASPIINLTLNDADSDITLQSSGGSVNITATLAAPDSGDLNLTQAGVLINSGASPLTNTSSFTTTGTYTILTSFAGNDNYTSGSKSHTITVPKKGGGGGSGGGGGDENSSEDNLTITQLFDVSSEFKTAGDRIEKTLGKGSGIEFTFANESHIIAVNEIYPDSVQMKISSKTSYVKINAGETEKIDMNGNGYYDAAITLNSLTAADATLEFELLQDIEKVPQKIGCAENWSCTNWTECNAEGAQIRACKDVNQCGNEENKPIEIQSCSPPSCDDKIRNQGEFGVDCGGPCAKRCNAQEIATTGKAVEVPSDEKVKIGTGLLMLLSMLVVLLFAINRVEHKIKLQKTNKGNFKKLRFEIILANIVHIIIIMAIVLLIYYLVK